jgi:electron transfer flavoprotein alpha subunit
MEPEKEKRKKPRGVARLLPGKCIACGARCQETCPKDAIEMNDRGEPIIGADKCIGCAKCVKICPVEALEIYLTPEERKVLEEMEKEAGAEAEREAEELSTEEAETAGRSFGRRTLCCGHRGEC